MFRRTIANNTNTNSTNPHGYAEPHPSTTAALVSSSSSNTGDGSCIDPMHLSLHQQQQSPLTPVRGIISNSHIMNNSNHPKYSTVTTKSNGLLSNLLSSSISTSSSSSSSYWSTSTLLVLIGFLLYLIVFQYGIILSKNETIKLILSQQQQQISGNNKNSIINHSKQFELLERFKDKKCDIQPSSSAKMTTTTATTRRYREVGVFPYQKPVTITNQSNSNRSVIVPPQPWIPYTTNVLPKVSYPIFVPSLPKSGTTSIWKYFKCGDQYACHNWVTRIPHTKATMLGKCIEDNINKKIPPFADCGPYDVYTDTGYLTYEHDVGEQCFYPSIDGLDAIYESYPNATFVNVVRDTESWYESLKGWSSASLFVRIRLCNATGFPDGQSTKADFMKMYDNFNAMIRKFVKDRPSITYIEVQLESKDTGRILEEAIGIDQSCWKLCKPQERHCRENDTPTTKDIAEAGGKYHYKHQQRKKAITHSNNQRKEPPKEVEQEVEAVDEGAEIEEEGDVDDTEEDGAENEQEGDDSS